MNALKDNSFDPQNLSHYIDLNESKHVDDRLPSVLVMNKVDLVTNRRRFKTLQHELEEIGRFDKVFCVSSETGFGVDELKDYVMEQAK